MPTQNKSLSLICLKSAWIQNLFSCFLSIYNLIQSSCDTNMHAPNAFYQCCHCNNHFCCEQGLSMHRSWISVCLNHYIASLKTILPKHHVESGTRMFTLSTQISGQSAHGMGLIKNNLDTIENGVENLDFPHDQVDIPRREKTLLLANSPLARKCKSSSQLRTCTDSALYATADSSKIQLLKLCSQAKVPLYFFESVLKGAAALSKSGADFSAGCQTQEKYLNDLSSQYKMKQLQPIQRSILLSDGVTVMPVTCFNSLEQIRSFPR